MIHEHINGQSTAQESHSIIPSPPPLIPPNVPIVSNTNSTLNHSTFIQIQMEKSNKKYNRKKPGEPLAKRQKIHYNLRSNSLS